MEKLNYISSSIILIVILVIVGYGLYEKNKVYDTFVEGAKEGINIVFNIFPTLVGMNFTRFIKEEKDNIIYAFILGDIVELCIFQIYAIPCIVTH